MKLELSPSQREAVYHTEGPLLVLAGAGSGKTRVLTARIAHIVDSKKAPPSGILAVTFTNKAAREMRERLARVVGAKASEAMTVSTFHSLGVKILREDGERLGMPKNFTIVNEHEREALLQRLIRSGIRGAKKEKPEEVGAEISLAKNQGLDPEGLAARHPEKTKLERIYRGYQKALQKVKCVDFDDLLWLPLQLFRACPDVLEKYRKRYRYLSIDEFQDTNAVQMELARLLAAPRNNIMAVGDDDQGIYSWRGAQLENILGFSTNFNGCRTIVLGENYRSTRQILEGALSVVSRNTVRKPKRLTAVSGEGEVLQHYMGDDEEDESEWIARDIKEPVKAGTQTYEDHAILVRTNSLLRRFEEGLRRNGVPYQVSGAMSFFERKEIKDCLAYLRFFSNPHDELSLGRVLKTPSKGIFPTTMEKLETLASARQISLWQAIERHSDCGPHPEEQARRLDGLMEYHRRHHGLCEQGKLSASLRAALIECGYWPNLEKMREPDGANPRLENVEEMIRGLEAFEAKHRRKKPSIESYLQELALLSGLEEQDAESRKKGVQLMTFHRSKGLEFPIVYMAGLDNDIFPSPKSLAEGGICEERRLFYVGMTRARKRLVFTWPKTKLLRKKVVDVNFTCFLSEVPEELLDGPLGVREEEQRDVFVMDFFAQLKGQLGLDPDSRPERATGTQP